MYMIDLQDKHNCPTLEEIGEYICNPIFHKFYSHIKTLYRCNEKIEFSSCS
jgi:AraC family transcriptional regulator